MWLEHDGWIASVLASVTTEKAPSPANLLHYFIGTRSSAYSLVRVNRQCCVVRSRPRRPSVRPRSINGCPPSTTARLTSSFTLHPVAYSEERPLSSDSCWPRCHGCRVDSLWMPVALVDSMKFRHFWRSLLTFANSPL